MAIKLKKQALKVWRETQLDADKTQYRLLKSEAKRAVADVKNCHYQNVYNQLDMPEGANSIEEIRITFYKAPKAWTTSTTVPIWKGKGDISESANYRLIQMP